MTIDVRLRDLQDTGGLKELIERRLAFATDRFAGRILYIQVRVADVNGTRGGVDKHCSLRAVLAGGHSIAIEERSPHAAAAVNRAVRCLATALGRVIPRKRRPLPAIPVPESLTPLAC